VLVVSPHPSCCTCGERRERAEGGGADDEDRVMGIEVGLAERGDVDRKRVGKDGDAVRDRGGDRMKQPGEDNDV
jgi:hypothetical protein